LAQSPVGDEVAVIDSPASLNLDQAEGEIFGDEVTATAMIDRLVHHAEILSLKGDSYRLRDKDLGAPPPHD
jgi:DNA replication protein DnaC